MFVLLLGVGTPNISLAQTAVTTSVQVSVQEQLIELMTQLIGLLRQKMALGEGTVTTPVETSTVTAAQFAAGIEAKGKEFEATNPEFPGKDKVTYRLDDEDSVADMSEADMYILELIKTLAPTEEVKNSIKEFTVYFDEDDTTDASVTPIDDEGNEFVFEINYKAVEEFDLFVPVIVHEFTHIFTLLDAQYVSVRENEDIEKECKNYITEGEGCFETDSYMNAYFQKFWKNSGDYQKEDRAEDETEKFFETRTDKYVTDYATTNPIEDIAESFMYFTSKDPISTSDVKGQKVDFFNAYTELVDYRNQVRSEISSWAK